MNFPGPSWPPKEFMTLTDGRKLAFRRIGQPGGTPVLFFHGTPGSHTLGFMAADAARDAGYEMIAPDRPGIGDSDPQPEREHRHYPLDIVQLLHHLKIKRCGILGISGGAPYALQCAYDLPDHISFLALLSGWLCYGRPEAAGIALPRNIKALKWLYKSKILAAPFAKAAEYTVRHHPQQFLAHLKKSLPAADLALIEQDFYRDLFLYDLQRAYKQGWHGPTHDGALQFRNQPFPLTKVTQPTLLLHGTADSVVPLAMAEAMNEYLPNVKEFIKVPEGGHLCAATEEDAVFSALHNLIIS